MTAPPQGAAIITDLIQVIYMSQPFGYDDATLSSILLSARRCNTRDGITGALICRHDIYLQLLEGPVTQVQATYQRICRDDRHAGVRELVYQPVTDRIFGDWAMLHDPATSLMWSREEVDAGALDRASQDEVLAVFKNLAVKAGDLPPY